MCAGRPQGDGDQAGPTLYMVSTHGPSDAAAQLPGRAKRHSYAAQPTTSSRSLYGPGLTGVSTRPVAVTRTSMRAREWPRAVTVNE